VAAGKFQVSSEVLGLVEISLFCAPKQCTGCSGFRFVLNSLACNRVRKSTTLSNLAMALLACVQYWLAPGAFKC
jgi:hypothetical protein